MNNIDKKIAVIFPRDSEALFNINSTRTFGGASVQMYGIAKELAMRSHIRAFSIIPDYNKIDFLDLKYFNLVKYSRPGSCFFIKGFCFLLKILKIRPDVIIQHGLTRESRYLSLFCRLLRIKLIFMFAHDIEAYGLSQTRRNRIRFFKNFLRRTDILITQNIFQKQYIQNRYDITSKIIHNGFEISGYSKPSVKNVLWVARCEAWKRPEIFIELARQNPDKNFIMICPPANDEKYYHEITEAASDTLNLEFIRFVPLSEIDDYFKNASVFVNTSSAEGFPQTFIQACMNGLPILSLEVNPDKFITAQACGMCCDGDFSVLCDGLNSILSNNDLFSGLSQNAYNYALKNHNIRNNVNSILEAL